MQKKSGEAMNRRFPKVTRWQAMALPMMVGLGLLALSSLSAVHAQPRRKAQTAIALGAINQSSPSGQVVGKTLRTALRTQLSELPDVRQTASRSAHFVLNASVTRLTKDRLRAQQRVGCEVSVVIADEEGTVRLMLSGRSVATGNGETLVDSAVRAAVRGAMRPLGKSLRALK